MGERKTSITWILAAALTALEQGVKLVINRWFLDISVPIVPPVLYFEPMFNRHYSWFNSMLRLEGGRWLHIAVVAVLIAGLLWLYLRLRSKGIRERIIDIMSAFLFAGAACSLIDKVFWDGSLDYILLSGFFTFDLKDVYINVFNGLLLYLLIFRGQYLNDIARALSGRPGGKDGPMKVLIIYAHPDPESFNHAILEQVKRGFAEAGHTVTVIDLYADGYDPVLVFNAQVRRRDLKGDVRRYQEMIREADHLVYIYPIWWYGLPAILKGFIDRVFVYGFAYTFQGGLPKGLLKGKSAWVLYTMGTPGWFVSLIRRNTEWTVMRDGVLRYCGIGPIKKMRFAGINGSTQKRRERWLEYVYRTAKELSS